MSLTQELKNLAMVDIFTEAKKTIYLLVGLTILILIKHFY